MIPAEFLESRVIILYCKENLRQASQGKTLPILPHEINFSSSFNGQYRFCPTVAILM
jgi:hypothetical protein